MTSEKLSELSVRLREAAVEARQAARTQQDRSSDLHFEMLQNLKKLADQIREILWREMRTSATNLSSSPDSRNHAAELFALLARIAAAQQSEAPTRSFFEEIENTVDRTLSRLGQPDDSASNKSAPTRAA